MTIEQIESRLKTLNGDNFHRLGDHFLYYDQGDDYSTINPIGQAEGKQKSRGGIPDTLITLGNGKSILIQYTTQDDQSKSIFNAKLLKDLRDCFDEGKTNIANKDIKEVVLCFTSNLSTATENLLKKEAEKHGVKIKLFNLSTIAHKIYRSYQYLAKDYLGLEIDSHQMLPLRKFVEEYERGGLATPLSIPLLERKEEKKTLTESLNSNFITILSGKPGVGKSRLAVEAVKDFVENRKEFISICIRNKDQSIIHDLRKSLLPGKKYLIYIDDANKSINHLKAIFTFYQETGIDIKLILTVRDYLIKEIIPFADGMDYETIKIGQLSESTIRAIISAEPFNIKNEKFQDRIIEISKGNPRLAIMTAIAAKDKTLNELASVSEIYNLYFEKITVDRSFIFQPEYLKVLGVLSFFRILDKEHPDTKKFLKRFKIKNSVFWEIVYKLEKLEIVDVYSDQSSARLSDQIMETYMFYRVFFIDKKLDYKTLLNHFYNGYRHRIRTTIIEAHNTFGLDDFGKRIIPFIKDKYETIKQDETKLRDFLAIFWFYLQDETLLFAKKQIDTTKQGEKLSLSGKLITDKQSTKVPEVSEVLKKDLHDDLFGLLSEFIRHDIPNFETATELLISYVDKHQNFADIFIKIIKENFNFNYSDQSHDYYRQVHFSRHLINKVDSGEAIFTYIFLSILPHFLKTSYNSTEFSGNKFAITKNFPKESDTLLEVREMYWECYIRHFIKYKTISLWALKQIIGDIHRDDNFRIRVFDWPYLNLIIDTYFDFKNLEDAYIANRILDKMELLEIKGDNIIRIRSDAMTLEYTWFVTLDWSLSKRLERKLNKEKDWRKSEEKFRIIKRNKILATFQLTEYKHYQEVFDFILSALEIDFWQHFTFVNSVQIILDKAIDYPDIILQVIKNNLQQEYFFKLVYPQWLFNTIQNKRPELLDHIEKLLLEENYPNKSYILISLYDTLHPNQITPLRTKTFLNIISLAVGTVAIYFTNVEYYINHDKLFLAKAVKSLVKQSNDKKLHFTTQEDFLEKHFLKMESDLLLSEDFYLHMVNNGFASYDYQGSELLFLVNKNPTFFLKYLDLLMLDKNPASIEHHQLSVVWKSKHYQKIMSLAVEKLISSGRIHYIFDEIVNYLFDDMVGIEDFDQRKSNFFQAYISQNKSSVEKIEGIFKIIVGRAGSEYHQIIKHYLLLIPDLDLFKKIDWLHRTTVLMSGNSITGEIDEGKWQKIKNLIDELSPSSAYLEHKTYITQQIDKCRKYAANERRRNFLRSFD